MAESGFYVPAEKWPLLMQTAIVEINAKLEVLTLGMIELQSALFSIGREDVKKRFEERLRTCEIEQMENLVQKFGDISSEGG